MSTKQRLSIRDVDADAYKAVFPLQKYATSGTLEAGLIALVDIRASQLNGCAWCLDMHAEEARQAGISQRKIDLVAAWREADELFTDAEQAALAFTEEVTTISDGGVSDDVWQATVDAFGEQETVRLLMVISVINVWNRMNVATRAALENQSEQAA